MTYLVHPIDENQRAAMEAFFKALKIPFEKGKESEYSPAFEAKILKGKKEAATGGGKTVTLEELAALCK